MPPNCRRLAAGVVLLGMLAACGTSEPPDAAIGAGGRSVDADFHTLKTPLRPEGAIDLLTVSTLPDAVTGGDVLMAVRGLDASDTLRVHANGREVTQAFAQRDDGEWRGLVAGLSEGENRIVATAAGDAGSRRAELVVINHPVSGPIISGPHQTPFNCRTEDNGLGPSTPPDCMAEPQVQWFARLLSQGWVAVEDPFAGYPPGTMFTQTDEGKTVPYVARVETRVINRGIARFAVLDDPAARTPEDAFEPASWNGKVYYVYGESCGHGYGQGSSSPDFVLGGFPDLTAVSADALLINLAGVSDRLGSGDVTAHNTLSAYGNHCNPLISIETTMMMKEHITEQYGAVKRVVGTNGSGAALQQYNAANNAPGLLSAGLPTATFADIPSTAMTVADCGLLLAYYERSDLNWTQRKQWSVNGHNALSGNTLNAICSSWQDAFLDRLDPTDGSGCGATDEQRYHPVDNPTGARCAIQDANVNLFGTMPHPEHGAPVARRPLDNTGVQYGLGAFNAGQISFEEFLDLNRNIGGYDIDGNWQPERMAMDPEVERITYLLGGVIGRGALAETPFIDIGAYLDLIPVANIHEAVRPFTVRDRLRPRAGGGETQSIFRGVLTQPDVYPLMDRWLDNLAVAEAASGAGGPAERIARVIDAKPVMAEDRCSFGTIGGRLELPGSLLGPLGLELPLLPTLTGILGLPGVELLSGQALSLRVDVPENFDRGVGPCAIALPITATPRMVAGMPRSGDIIRCQRKPVDPRDYDADLTAEQLLEIEAIFPEGVCDYTRPAAGDTEDSLIWPSIGGRQPLPQPVSLRWRVARGLAD
ncbi:DUF6351 family protein [Algiphilus sp.]|uniref:DUF6351 family protein n=1 Tax=Algiphilus sp. TaxID=1872431 RepID=UPI002A62C573|nr:DUF6351 family protein [Pseudomonadota bacterium]